MSQYSFDAVILDLDGVITQTASIHFQAWKATFDEYLRLREKRNQEEFREFTYENDYLLYVDGKPRYEGVKSFLESRGINIAFGKPSDSPRKETICGIGNKKNLMFLDIIRTKGVEVYPSTIKFIKSLKKAGIRIGVASSSKSCKLILKAAGIEELFETRVDGIVSAQLKLKGKPEGDIFVRAARNLGARPAKSVVVEDAISGVLAGRNGGFGLVLGVARKENEAELFDHGADMVVQDLGEINIEIMERWFKRKPRPLFKSLRRKEIGKEKKIVNPCYFRSFSSILFSKKKFIFFLDYDGTLTPIVKRPELAVMNKEMRAVVRKLSRKHTVVIVSGRLRREVEKLVGIKGLLFAGSQGFDIKGPKLSMLKPEAKKMIPLISKIIKQLRLRLKNIPGVLVEEKKFSVAVHYRLVNQKHLPKIKKVVDSLVKKQDKLLLLRGKKVYEILPDIDWDKGKAIRWIMQALKISWRQVTAVYLGDDVVDEDAFRTIRTRGIGILVSQKPKESAADFQLFSTKEVKRLFEKIIVST